MWKVLVFASWLGVGSWTVDVLLSGMGDRAASGTIFSAVLEMGSRAWTSVTEAKPREKTAGRMAGGGLAMFAYCYDTMGTCAYQFAS